MEKTEHVYTREDFKDMGASHPCSGCPMTDTRKPEDMRKHVGCLATGDLQTLRQWEQEQKEKQTIISPALIFLRQEAVLQTEGQ